MKTTLNNKMKNIIKYTALTSILTLGFVSCSSQQATYIPPVETSTYDSKLDGKDAAYADSEVMGIPEGNMVADIAQVTEDIAIISDAASSL